MRSLQNQQLHNRSKDFGRGGVSASFSLKVFASWKPPAECLEITYPYPRELRSFIWPAVVLWCVERVRSGLADVELAAWGNKAISKTKRDAVFTLYIQE